jgi:dTDP-4-dehydrorhamnose 3,5-epimerase
MDIHVEDAPLQGVKIIHTDYFRDERGFFIENYHKQRFAEHGIPEDFVQDNHSGSAQGVLRGLHYQDETAPMGKLVRCTEGAIFDVAVDLRVGSPTFGRWFGIELSAENMDQVFIPSGFAHGFVTLSSVAQVQYKCTGFYTPSSEGTLNWDDPDVGIDWRVQSPTLSARDRNGISLRDYVANPAFAFSAGTGDQTSEGGT